MNDVNFGVGAHFVARVKNRLLRKSVVDCSSDMSKVYGKGALQ